MGSFTSLRYVNGAYEGFRERPTEALLAKWSGSLGGLTRLTSKRVHALNPSFLQVCADLSPNPNPDDGQSTAASCLSVDSAGSEGGVKGVGGG